MSALADRIATEHLHWPGMERCRCGVELVERGCGCNEATDAYTRHVAEVTEQATRAQIAADIAEYADRDVPCWKQPGVRDVVADSFATTVRIAKGGAS